MAGGGKGLVSAVLGRALAGALGAFAADGYFESAMTARTVLPVAAAATFIVAFGVAELTGVRALGGLILLAGGAGCALLTLRLAGPVATAALVAIALVLFVASHPLGHAIGTWAAVAVSALSVAAVSAVVTHIWRKTDASVTG